jgi:hypothetical protein
MDVAAARSQRQEHAPGAAAQLEHVCIGRRQARRIERNVRRGIVLQVVVLRCTLADVHRQGRRVEQTDASLAAAPAGSLG